ncbi:MAG: hypothetical protein RLZZ618_2937 [Pseudomonadota bacterium]|jgi:transcriptional regulator with XRE-family HTH domain
MPTTSAPLLGAFIRSHRERLSPAAAGLPPGLRRRAPGLRREEVAALCGISPTWLTWIEQGRARSLSPATLARLATALQLTAAERDYLFDLAALRDPQAHGSVIDPVLSDTLARAVSKFASPAYVLDHDWNAVAWNRKATRLFGDWLVRRNPDRNLLHYMFLNPAARALVCDWSVRARRLVAEFRADRSASLDEPACRERVARLRQQSPDFDAAWRQHDVLDREGGERRFAHPIDGELVYDQLTLRVASAHELKLVVLV